MPYMTDEELRKGQGPLAMPTAQGGQAQGAAPNPAVSQGAQGPLSGITSGLAQKAVGSFVANPATAASSAGSALGGLGGITAGGGAAAAGTAIAAAAPWLALGYLGGKKMRLFNSGTNNVQGFTPEQPFGLALGTGAVPANREQSPIWKWFASNPNWTPQEAKQAMIVNGWSPQDVSNITGTPLAQVQQQFMGANQGQAFNAPLAPGLSSINTRLGDSLGLGQGQGQAQGQGQRQR